MVSGIGVMSPAEGTAWRYQIDGMLGALRPLASLAGEAGPVADLVSALELAREAAARIESPPAAEAAPVRKGVNLLRK